METTQENAVNLNSRGLKIGAALGLMNVILYLLIYLVDPTIFGSFWLGIISLVVLIVMLIYISRYIRRINGGAISFGKLFQSLLIALSVSIFIGTAFNVILNTVIDPQLPVTIKESVKQKTFDMMQKWNIPEETIDETMEQMDKQDYSPNIKNTSTQLLGILFFSAILALIFAAIFKKKPEKNYEQLLDSSGGNNQ